MCCFFYLRRNAKGIRSTALRLGWHDERVAGGPTVDTPSGDWRTTLSITFQDMISTKINFFNPLFILRARKF